MAFDTLEDCLDQFFSREDGFAEELNDAVENKKYPAAYAALRKLREPLSGRQAEACLTNALSCTPKLFREILEHCEPGEYANSMKLTRRSEREEQFFRVHGTILTLAAALDKPEHAAILLEKGWDANARAPASIQALLHDREKNGVLPCVVTGKNSHIACGSKPDFLPGTDELWEIPCATPLAAAIACGSLSTAELLLARADVKKLENPAVCLAAVAALHGDVMQRWCLEAALGIDCLLGTDLARELLVKHAPDIAEIAALSTPGEFALRLSGAPCSRQRLLAAAATLCPTPLVAPPEGADEKLFLLLDRYPELEKEQSVRDRMLNAALARQLSGQACDALLNRWKAACGESRDISNVDPEFVSKLALRRREIFDKLGEGGTLRASAESEWLAFGDKRLLSGLLDRVEIYRTEIGIGGVVRRIMQTGDVGLMRKAAERGVLRWWRRDELLEALREESVGTALRALALALPEEQIGGAAAHSREKGGGEWRQWSRSELTECLAQMWEQPLCAEECRKRLRFPPCRLENWPFPNFDVEGMLAQSFSGAACCGKNPELLRVLLEDGVCDPNECKTVIWLGSSEALNGTLLCMAAAAGRTEQVKMLLDLGLDPNEDDVPQRSVYYEDNLFGTSQVVTPLYMALKKGQLETAELLRAHGGYAYPTGE